MPIDTFLAWKGAVVFGWLAALFVLERIIPAAARPADFPGSRLLRNAVLLSLTILSARFLVVPFSAIAAQHALAWRPIWWSGPRAVIGDLLFLDFLIYWWHRANHEIPILWRFHEVHHLDRFLDTTTALRFHFGEVIISAAARAVVIVLLDLSLATVIGFESLVLGAAIFHHSNARLPMAVERALSFVVVTPSIHWVHHHRVKRDTNANYSTIFSFWDRLFGSRSVAVRLFPMEIGTEGQEEVSALALIVRPFVGRPACL
jgi:sterol desaturase/sphingolipid hydroxylase (fatty acid hydroxylase superfamily)